MSDGSFAFREKAAAALEKAKRIVDLLDVPTRVPQSDAGLVLGTYGNRIIRLIAWARGPMYS